VKGQEDIMPKTYETIEFPSAGKTYRTEKYGVYRYGTYERGSVLEGQEKRSFLGEYDTLEEAKANHPDAEYSDGSQYREVFIPHTAPEWFDPADAGETWDEQDAY
jgi:hypothetical protein